MKGCELNNFLSTRGSFLFLELNLIETQMEFKLFEKV